MAGTGAIFVDGSLEDGLDDLTTQWNTNVHKLYLFQNNFVPLDSSVLGDFTEATFSGYASQSISYTAASLVGDFAICADSAARTFTVGMGGVSNTIYGYYVVDQTTGLLVYAERFSASINMNTVGATITLTVQVTLSSLNQSH